MQDIRESYFDIYILNKILNSNNTTTYRFNLAIINIFNKLILNLFVDNK